MSSEIATLQMSRPVKSRLDDFAKKHGLKLKYCADKAISEWLDKQLREDSSSKGKGVVII